MAAIILLKVFTPEEAREEGKPYSLEWNLQGASKEQMISLIKLMGVLRKRLKKHTEEYFPGAFKDNDLEP